MEYSKQSLEDADLVIFVYDAHAGMTKEDEEILELAQEKKHLVIANKCDLISERKDGIHYISAKTGEGIAELKELITKQVCDIEPDNLEFVTNSRQQVCLARAKTALEQALLGAQLKELQDLISIDVKSAILALDEITGELITDDVLDNIFTNFCIGK